MEEFQVKLQKTEVIGLLAEVAADQVEEYQEILLVLFFKQMEFLLQQLLLDLVVRVSQDRLLDQIILAAITDQTELLHYKEL